MTAKTNQPTPFQRPAQHILPGGGDAYTMRVVDALVVAIESTQLLTPQRATNEPRQLYDGMMRLARQPWQPLQARLGITVDCWVYYDSALPGWRHIGENPTNT